MAVSNAYADGWWQSPDGIKLHYRDYPGGAEAAARPPILCIPGLTRNARDFEEVAQRLSPEWRVICVDLRGRGESAAAPMTSTYALPSYVLDIAALFVALKLEKVVLFGTSLGGILAMLIAATTPERLAGVLLNDVGPVLEPSGLARIHAYVGKNGSWPTWLHAARALGEMQRDAYPEYRLEEWLAMAKRLCRLTPAGRIVFDYDLRIAEPFRDTADAPPVDLWPAFGALADRPVLLVRGARSDILSSATAAQMAERVVGLEVATVPDVGHAPTLAEPEARVATARLLERVLSGR